MQTDFFLCISVLRVASGPRVKLASCKSALKKGKRNVQGVPHSHAAALPRHQEKPDTRQPR